MLGALVHQRYMVYAPPLNLNIRKGEGSKFIRIPMEFSNQENTHAHTFFLAPLARLRGDSVLVRILTRFQSENLVISMSFMAAAFVSKCERVLPVCEKTKERHGTGFRGK